MFSKEIGRGAEKHDVSVQLGIGPNKICRIKYLQTTIHKSCKFIYSYEILAARPRLRINSPMQEQDQNHPDRGRVLVLHLFITIFDGSPNYT